MADEQIRISLHDPGMSIAHRVGLAGLWMTLRALQEENGAPQLAHGQWQLTSDGVELRLRNAACFFAELTKKSFRIVDGLICFATHPRETLSREVVILHRAFLETFLAVPVTREAEPKQQATGQGALEIEGEVVIYRYQKVSSYLHQSAGRNVGSSGGWLEVAKWQWPSATQRHVSVGATKWREPLPRWLALLYLPVGSIFYELRVPGDQGTAYAMVLPHVLDLNEYWEARRALYTVGAEQFVVTGPEEAILRAAVSLRFRAHARLLGVERWQVVVFKTRAGSQQKIPSDARIISLTDSKVLNQFARAQAYSPVVLPAESKEFDQVRPNRLLGLVARNLVEGRKWWEGFGAFLFQVSEGARKPTSGDGLAPAERGGLQKMVEDTQLTEPTEHAFIQACQEAWRRRLGQLSERARRTGADFRRLASVEYTRQRTAFARCRTADMFRQAIADFWSRSGPGLVPLADNLSRIIPYLADENWRKARDLALVALASYRAQESEELLSQEEPQEVQPS